MSAKLPKTCKEAFESTLLTVPCAKGVSFVTFFLSHRVERERSKGWLASRGGFALLLCPQNVYLTLPLAFRSNAFSFLVSSLHVCASRLTPLVVCVDVVDINRPPFKSCEQSL